MYKSLEEFSKSNQLNDEIIRNMVFVTQLQEGYGRFENKAYFCMSTAYKICRDMIKHFPVPYWRVPDYFSMAAYSSQTDEDLKTVMKAVTMTIVHILSSHLDEDWQKNNEKLIHTISSTVWSLKVAADNKPRPLSGMTSAIDRVMGIIPTCGKIFNSMYNGTNIDYVIPFEEFFDEDEKSSVKQLKEKSDNSKHTKEEKTETKVLVDDKEIQEYISSLNRQLSDVKDRNSKLTQKIAELHAVLELDKVLKDDKCRLQIDERIILITTALGTTWDDDLTNQTQVAKLIEHFSSDDWRSIRSRIVAINKEMKIEREHPGEGLSQGTKEAVNNAIGWMNKVTKGETNTPATEKLIAEVKDVFLNIKE